MLDKKAVEKHLKYFQENKSHNEIYVALLLYEVYDLNVKDLNHKIIRDTYDIIDKYETIYDRNLKDDIREKIYIEKEKE